MRVNVYREELTTDVEVVDVHVPEKNTTYYGVRLYLASSNKLHNTPDDDDRSAVTIWTGDDWGAHELATAIHNVLTDTGLDLPNE